MLDLLGTFWLFGVSFSRSGSRVLDYMHSSGFRKGMGPEPRIEGAKGMDSKPRGQEGSQRSQRTMEAINLS